MSKTLHVSNTHSASETLYSNPDYWYLGSGDIGLGALDGADNTASVSYHSRKPGTWSNLAVKFRLNGTTSPTFKSQKNGGDGALVVSASADGIVQDNTHTDHVADGDFHYWKASWSGSNKPYLDWMRSCFEADSGHVVHYAGAYGGINNSYADDYYYTSILGGCVDSGLSFEWGRSEAETKVHTAGTLSNFAVIIDVCDIPAQWRLVKNGTDTALIINVPDNASGLIEDNTHTVTVADGDRICQSEHIGTKYDHSQVTGQCGGATHITFTSSTLKTDHAWGTFYYQAPSYSTLGYNYTSAGRFMPLGGAAQEKTVEANNSMSCGFAGTASRMRVYINSDPGTLNQTATFRFRKNGADGNQVLTAAANVSGWVEDTTHTDTFTENDTMSIRFTGGTSGRISYQTGITIEYQVSTVQIPAANPIVTEAPSFGTATLFQNHLLTATAIATEAPSFGTASLTENIRKRIAESQNLNEAKLRVRGLVADLVGEAMSINELRRRARAFVRRKALGINVNEAKNKLRTRVKLLADQTNIDEDYTLVKTAIRFYNEAVQQAEAAALHFRGFARYANEALGISDAYERVSGFVRPIAEAVQQAEAKFRARARVWIRLEEFLTYEYALPSLFRGSRIINEGLEAVEQYVRSREVVRALASTLELAEVIPNRTIGTILAIAEGISIAWARNKFRLRIKRKALSVEQAETKKKLRFRTRLRAAAIQIDDGKQHVIGLFKYRPEEVRQNEISAIARGFAQVWTEAQEAGEALLRYLWQVKVRTEELNYTDFLWRSRHRARIRREWLWLEESFPRSMYTAAAVVVSWIGIQAKRGWEVGVVRRISEIIESAQSALIFFGRIKLASEAVQLVDAFVRARARIIRSSDSLNLAETFGRMTGMVVRALEAIEASEAFNIIRGKIRYVIELHNLAETRARYFKRLRLIADALNIATAQSWARHLLRRFADAISLDELREHTKFRRKIRNETQRHVEYLAHGLGLLRLRAEEVRPAELLKRAFHRLRIRAEFVASAEAGLRRRMMRRVLAEAEQVSEYVEAFAQLLRYVLELTNLAEVRTRLRDRLRFRAESANLDETRKRLRARYRQIAANVSLGEGTYATRFIAKVRDFAVSIVETLHSPIEVIAISIDGLNIVEALATRRFLMRLPTEIMQAVEQLNLRRDYIRFIPETLRENERIVRARGMFVIAATEVVEMVDGAIGSITHIIHSLVLSAVRFRAAVDTLFRSKPEVSANIEAEPVVGSETPTVEPAIKGDVKLRGP